MNENHWKTENSYDPYRSVYQTGSTHPRKSKSGLIAVLLAVVILLGGVVTILGLMNVQLFRKLENSPEQKDPYVQFSPDDTTQTQATTAQQHTPAGNTQIEIENTPQGVPNVPQEGGLSLQEIYQKAIDSVVSISCAASGGNSTGTGVVISTDGYLITNYHVVEGAREISVLLTDERTLSATLLGFDALSDLAVLQVEATDLKAAEFGDSAALQVGDSVVAIGDPLGAELRGTMTNGIVSAINRDVSTGGRTMTLIQTNAALNSGNSGGPLLNCYGQVVGINTMKIGDYMSSAGVEGLGFAIPSTTVKEIVDQLLSQGYVSGRPSIGFTGQTITSFDRLYYHLPQGVYITQVETGSDAAKKGISTGDILTHIGQTRIADMDSLEKQLFAYNAGATIPVTIYRSGKTYSLKITLGEAK
ncbi:MAG: trypsin-like peptidase domain-containing protein [Oscillospiraceae bacterium]|nr:trypsin-like peptidase domain-containing protein [Oscillospiraceae bacterium]